MAPKPKVQAKVSAFMNPMQPQNFSIVDVYSGGSLDLELQRMAHEYEREKKSEMGEAEGGDARFRAAQRVDNCCMRLLKRLGNRSQFLAISPAAWAFLIILGTCAALAAWLIDLCTDGLLEARASIAASSNNFALGYLAWVLWTMGFAMLAGTCGHFVSKNAEGSGIPEMKAILSGTLLKDHVSIICGKG